jgi:hypothetical protein
MHEIGRPPRAIARNQRIHQQDVVMLIRVRRPIGGSSGNSEGTPSSQAETLNPTPKSPVSPVAAPGRNYVLKKSKESGGEGGIRTLRPIHEDQHLSDLTRHFLPLQSP